MAFTKVTVTGTVKDAKGSPVEGANAKFVLSNTIVSMDDGVIATQSPVIVSTDANGAFSVELNATDDATTQPKGQVYQCTIQTPNSASFYNAGSFPTIYFALSADSAPSVDISSLIYGQVPPGAVLTSIINAKGDIIAGTGPNQPARLPTGTDNRMLVTDSTQNAGLRWGPAVNYGSTPPTQNVQVGDLWFDTTTP